MAHTRADCRGHAVRQHERHRIPHHWSLRQDSTYREVLAHGRPAQQDSQRHTRLCLLYRHDLLRPQTAARSLARHHDTQLEHGRVDGAHTVPLRRGGRRAARQGVAAAHRRQVPRDNIAHVRRQPEVQRHIRRPRPLCLQGQRPHLRDDGGPALQGRSEEFLPDQYGAGLSPLFGGSQLRQAHRRRTGVRPLYRYGHHRQLRGASGTRGYRHRVRS